MKVKGVLHGKDTSMKRPNIKKLVERHEFPNVIVLNFMYQFPADASVFVDVDGTICSQKGRPNFADVHEDYEGVEPYPERIRKVNEAYDNGTHITYWTARGCHSGIDHTELTRKQLKEWGAKYHDLQVGNKPHFDMYICDKSYNADLWFGDKVKVNDK